MPSLTPLPGWYHPEVAWWVGTHDSAKRRGVEEKMKAFMVRVGRESVREIFVGARSNDCSRWEVDTAGVISRKLVG